MKKLQTKILITGGEGYLGSVISNYLVKKRYLVDSVDLEWFGLLDDIYYKKIDYRIFEKDDLKNYNVIIHLAGHSSNYLCTKDRLKSFDNNVIGFYKLLKSLTNQKFIYASSSTIYKSLGTYLHHEESNELDLSSLYEFYAYSTDRISQLTNKQVYGLRLGSVNGPSPNMRMDLVLNNMVQQAQQKGKILLSMPSGHLPILGILDFCRSIETILLTDPPTGIYNLASFNISILEIGEQVAKFFNVPIEFKKAEPSRDICVSTEKFKENLRFDFKDSIPSILHQLITDKNQHYFDERSA